MSQFSTQIRLNSGSANLMFSVLTGTTLIAPSLVMALRPISYLLLADFSNTAPSGVVTVTVNPSVNVTGGRTKMNWTASEDVAPNSTGGSQTNVTWSLAPDDIVTAGIPLDVAMLQGPESNSPLLPFNTIDDTDTPSP